MSRIMAWILVAAAGGGIVGNALAESAEKKEEYGFELCNRTRLQVTYAKALNVTSKSDKAKGKKAVITSEGWFDLPAGECAILYPGALKYRYYLVYAEAKNSNRKWTGKQFICVRQGKFNITGDTCPKNRDHRMFVQVDTGDSLSYTHDLK